ncbi:transitional endoplasmic reticulum ATPase [Flavobacterium omnivorum]|uniref:Transitional endoplasmic reticulum ATPase n=1 Tax=Flavobacterium omnivorum TaxID=178355 RepID=A0A1G8G4X2_9FLAO|nr:AAA family ATPase [Flavobacterium omnivorum]SDH89453.1 transitional endoplasmic reticulum ATPase [Flavobacterium omnivorum]
MDILKQSILPKNFSVNGKYNVLFFIKKGNNAETYRVKGNDGKLYLLKLFNYAKLQRSAFDVENNLFEIEFIKSFKHPNIVAYKDDGELIYEGKKFSFLVLNFIAGETLSDRISRDPISTIYDVKQIITGILNGLNYLHNLPEPIIHNEITTQNIMLDLSQEIPQPIIIDFGFARSFHQSTKTFDKEGLNLNYVASECFNNLYSPQSDLFSVGAVMYHMLFGMAPWFKDISKYKADRVKMEEVIVEERKKPLKLPNIESDIVDFDESILKIIKKALQQDPENRFQSANEFIQAINGEIEIKESSEKKLNKEVEKSKSTLVKKGKGFSAIAGMSNLKQQLQNDVINVIENPEEYKKHNLGLPNGMLLYGPPGCGKTFFAERFAEEAGYNFIKVVSSDLASIYVHGSQEKIGKLFKEAREQAPTILYFDELDAMVPSREIVNNQSQSGEVNEFLSQLDNIGESGVFVIGSTNKPNTIDKAALRAGRLEKWFYIPPPDFEARKAMFELYLKDRPLDFGIDYTILSNLTENYVSSDIKLLIDEASRKTIRDKSKRISMEIMTFIINNQKPTVELSELKKYEAIRRKIEEKVGEDNSDARTKIGF